jgi:branched-chain amino acid transport system permease protein
MTGLVSLGHAAFLGIGAYVTAIAMQRVDTAPVWVVLPLAVLAAAAYALFVGALSLRTRGVYFIMVTLAFAQMAYFVFHDTKIAGGSDGMFLYSKPGIELGGTKWLDLDNKLHLYYAVVASLAFTYGLLALVRRSRFGHALAGIRVNEQRMRGAGFPTYAYKLAAFVLAGALAGLAGFLIAVKDGAVNPELASWHESGGVLLMIILGGIGHLRGAVLGAIALTLLKEFFQTEAWLGPLASHWQLSFGFTVIVFVALLPQGLIGLRRALTKRRPLP